MTWWEALPTDNGVRDLKGQIVREGYVIHSEDAHRPENKGQHSPMRDAQTSHAIYRVCDHASFRSTGDTRCVTRSERTPRGAA